MRPAIATLMAALAVSASTAAAHHAISAYYDSAKRASIEGVVVQFHFVSPHPYVTVDVTQNGATRQWRLEMDNRGELSAIGMRGDTLTPGDRVVVEGSLARDQSAGLYIRRLTRPADGFIYEQVGSSPRLVSPGRARRQ